MFQHSVSWITVLFILLEVVVRTQLTAYDNSHGFLSNNHDRYLVKEISSMQEELSSDIRSATISKLKMHLKFEPEFLDFKQRPLGVPHMQKVTLINVDRNRTIDMTSISGNTVYFHSSFFENKKIPPLGNTSFSVVFLGREEGAVESNLLIHTTDGHFKYHVKGASSYSPYRLRPFTGIKIPVNTSFTPIINLYNPHPEPIQIVEVYSSGGDFHLELPTGDLEGPKDMWEILPLETKAIIKIRFFGKVEQNHTAYIRIKLNNTSDILVVPIDIEVTSKASLYARQGYIDFGVGGSLDSSKIMQLNLNNPLKKSLKISSIIASSKAIKIEHDNKSIKSGSNFIDVATLKLNWKTAYDNKDFSGKIIISYKNSKFKSEIPYYITVIEGGLTFNKSSTRFFISDKTTKFASRKIVIKNEFLAPVMLINFTMPEDAKRIFNVANFSPLVLTRKEEKTIFSLTINDNINISELKIKTHITLSTNISNFDLPLTSYNGKFELKLPYKSNDNSLDLGLISFESRKVTFIMLINKNPVVINIKDFKVSLNYCHFENMGTGRRNPEQALLQENYKNLTLSDQIKPGEYVIFKISIISYSKEAQIWGDLTIYTQYEQLSIPVHYKNSNGKLEIGPDRLVFDQCFPGKICSHPLRVHSTFNEHMVIEDILTIPPDPRISTKYVKHISPRATKVIGTVFLDPNIICQQECYLGLQEENKISWLKTLILNKYTTEFDLNMVNILYNRYLNETLNGVSKWQNITMRLDTSEVKGHLFKTRVKMSWPSLISGQTFENKSILNFPLTQIGKTIFANITIKNPSTYDLMVQIIIDQFYPNFDILLEGLPPAFIAQNMEPLRKVRHGFFLDKPLGDLSNVHQIHKESWFLNVKPGENFTLRIGFKACDSTSNTAFLFIRNNLTILEVLQMYGKGAMPSFKFGNRKPGSHQALVFELTEKHLKDCDVDKVKKGFPPTLTVKRSFTARNTGDIPVYVYGFYINSLPCEGYGFKVLNCEAFELPPNGTKKIDIAFTPDFTLAKIIRQLVLKTSLNFPVNYTLVTTVPPYYLSLCSNVISRLSWESHLYYMCVALMLVLFIFILIAPILEAEDIIKESIDVPKLNHTQHILDLKSIGAQIKSDIQLLKIETPIKKTVTEIIPISEEKLIKPEGEKYTAVIPTTGKARKKSLKKLSDYSDHENRKKNWIETTKVKQEEMKSQEAHKNNKKSQTHKKVECKVSESQIEEETSSTTTESSNNEDIDKNLKNNKKNKVFTKEIKACLEEMVDHNKLERRRSNPKTHKPKEMKPVDNTLKPLNDNIKTKLTKKEKREKTQSSKKSNSEKHTKVTDRSNESSPSIRFSSVQSGNIWTENKASFSDVVARSEPLQKPVSQVVPIKPTVYVEPYKQTTTELGPIGSKKLDITTSRNSPSEEYNTFFSDAHNLAVESSNAFLDIPAAQDTWQQNTSSLLSLIQANNQRSNLNHNLEDPWIFPRSQCLSPWDNLYSQTYDRNADFNLNGNSGYLWGSSSVWQPWTPTELPRTPRRTPPGFAPHVDNEEERRHQNQLNYNPFGLSSIWTQPQTNPWNYPQDQ